MVDEKTFFKCCIKYIELTQLKSQVLAQEQLV